VAVSAVADDRVDARRLVRIVTGRTRCACEAGDFRYLGRLGVDNAGNILR
jgi:hypothetical protein